MNFGGTSVTSATLNDAINLLSAVNDPVAAKALLDEVAASIKDVDEKLATLAVQTDAFSKGRDAHALSLDSFVKQQVEARQALAAEQRNIREAAVTLAEQKKSHAAEVEKFGQDQQAHLGRVQAVVERESAVRQKEAELKSREATLAESERGVESLRQDLQRRVSQVKAAAA